MNAEKTRPFHVGVIMDGNGRWAAAHGRSRIAGHIEGAQRVTGIVKACPALGITHLTLFAFSTENWRRPVEEVGGLMRLFRSYILHKTEALREQAVRVRFIGMRHRVPAHLGRLMERMEARTAACRGLHLTIAIDYGGRDEIARAARAVAADVAAGRLAPEAVEEPVLAERLDTAGLPDPDFIIRTSGESRLSNFLLWQGVYAEYAFPAIAWPDFDAAAFAAAVDGFRGRDRRFGARGPRAVAHAGS
ncbi:polyprenyl diphosphate synthase [soil metagenome]